MKKESNKILTDYLNYKSSMGKSKSTITEYKYDLTNFFKYLINMSYQEEKSKFGMVLCLEEVDKDFLSKIDLSDLYSYMAYLKDERGDSSITRYRKAACIKGFFKYLRKLRIVDYNPAEDLEFPKLERRLPKYLTLEQSTTLLDNVKNKEITGKMHDNILRDYAMVTLFLNCGIRLAELVNINISHIDFSECILRVIGKGDKERVIYLNKACINALIDYMEVRPTDGDNDALFLSERRTRISRRTVQHIIKEYLKEVPGLDKYSTHKLRHTAATLMYQYGNVDIITLKELLGHENLQTTEIYVHCDNEKVRAAIESNPLANYK